MDYINYNPASEPMLSENTFAMDLDEIAVTFGQIEKIVDYDEMQRRPVVDDAKMEETVEELTTEFSTVALTDKSKKRKQYSEHSIRRLIH
ncbi:hypothetical protein BDF20DRAFT_952800 [Mycotypha africana]|uniref:uncharacterized protein n=1 Tax=Mycotypha africana TaxID=64632 RepID=UPI00230054D0|nr:uncharacterized protein BDF20DRAFT_952800 [Mycotypha africana]KAI8988031.1 hypothetical protein BDF20DRAFT_952800 [Mycotypha africana]